LKVPSLIGKDWPPVESDMSDITSVAAQCHKSFVYDPGRFFNEHYLWASNEQASLKEYIARYKPQQY
jgi:hypothetical protein